VEALLCGFRRPKQVRYPGLRIPFSTPFAGLFFYNKRIYITFKVACGTTNSVGVRTLVVPEDCQKNDDRDWNAQ
jgi:hypothetical protein